MIRFRDNRVLVFVRIIMKIEDDGTMDIYDKDIFCADFVYDGFGNVVEWYSQTIDDVCDDVCSQAAKDALKEANSCGVYEMVFEIDVRAYKHRYTGEYDEDGEVQNFKIHKLDDKIAALFEAKPS